MDEALVTEKERAAMAKTDRLGTERIGKLMLEFSIPAIVGMVFSSLYNVVDTAFLGIAFPDGSGVAVTTLAFPIMTILVAFSAWAGQGGNALAAIQLGEGKHDEVEKTLGNTALLLVLLALLIAIIAFVFIDPILALIGTTQELWELTKQFVQIVCVWFVFLSLGFGLSNFIRTAGRPNFALGTTILGTVMCIVFNYLFVLQLKWGVAGSAYATIVGQGIAAIPVLWFFIGNKSAPFKLRLHNCIPDFRLMGRILVMGLATFCMQIAGSVVGIVFNHVVGIYAANDPIGVTGALAAMGVAFKATGFAFTPFVGLMMGVQPIIGFNYGARNWGRVIRVFKWACLDGAIIGTFFFVLAQVSPEPIVALFGVHGELEAFAAESLQWFTIFFTFVGYQAIASSYFQSSGQPIKSAVLELMRQVIFLIPLYLFAPPILANLTGMTELYGVVICEPISDIMTTVVATAFVIREAFKLVRLRREEGPGAPCTPPKASASAASPVSPHAEDALPDATPATMDEVSEPASSDAPSAEQ